MTPVEILTYIRDVPDFPKKGILFKDITTALKEPEVFKSIIDNLAEMVKDMEIDNIVAVESRGYLLGAPLAYKLGKGLVIIRKPGKLPAEVYREEYSLEYGTDALEIHQNSLKKGAKVLIVDDLLATGGTAKATCRLVEKAGGKVIGALFLMELTALSQKAGLNVPVLSMIKC